MHVTVWLALRGYSAGTFDAATRAALRDEVHAWLTNTSNYDPGSAAPVIETVVGGGHAVDTRWSVPVFVTTASVGGAFQVQKGMRAISNHSSAAAFSEGFRTRVGGHVPPHFSIEVGEIDTVAASRFTPPTPPTPKPTPGPAPAGDVAGAIGGTVGALLLLLAAFLTVRAKKTGKKQKQSQEQAALESAPVQALALEGALGAAPVQALALEPVAPLAVGSAVGDLSKFIMPGKSLQLGTVADATAGIGSLLLGSNADAKLAQFTIEGVTAVEREFMQNGTAEDRSNYTKVVNGGFNGITLDALMAHASTKAAGLQRHHVLALRLYTSSSFARINDPMRATPPARPHPFAATVFFIFDGIKKLRHVEAQTPSAVQPRTLWRGVSGVSLTEEFMTKGGAEFACMSTSASAEVATRFCFSMNGQNPMLFKYETKSCIERSADIKFLSVYPKEEEVLYPPLTYLQFKGAQNEEVGGVPMLVVNVTAAIVGN